MCELVACLPQLPHPPGTGTPHHQVVPVACTFVEIQQCQLCNTKATMPSSFCLTVEAKAALQARLLLLLLLFPVVLCRTKIARFSLSLFVMPLPIPLHPPPAPALFHFSPASGCFFMSAICIGRFVDVFCTFAFSALRRGGKRREERLRGSGRERGELEREAAYKNNDIKMRIILKPDCPIC